jgi:tRNA threonylcarbamoyl adenosine modification protein YjeE
VSIARLLAERIPVVRQTAVDWRLSLVLKTARTLVGDPAGGVAIVPTGNPGMATGGTGDVLTGVIAGLIAQGVPVPLAARAGAYVHGLAGDLAADRLGPEAMLAGDLLGALPEAIRQVKTGVGGGHAVMTVLALGECELSWESASPEESLRAGEVLGRVLRPGDLVALFGELGSGKTLFVRGIAMGLGCQPEEVHSPSFTLVNEYGCAGKEPAAGLLCRLAHIDLYRIRSEDDLPGIGWDEYLSVRYIVAVEWAERAVRSLPRDHLRVRLETRGSDRRRVSAQATGSRSARIVREWLAALGVQVGPA